MKPSFVFACLASVLVLTVSINGAAISPASSSASLFRRMDNGEEKTNVEETDSQFNFPNVDTFGFEAKLAELVAKAPKESLHVWYNDKREIARIVSKSENAVETEMTLDVFWNRGDLQSTTIEKTKLALIPGIPAVVVAEPGKECKVYTEINDLIKNRQKKAILRPADGSIVHILVDDLQQKSLVKDAKFVQIISDDFNLVDKPQFIKKKCLASFDADESDAKSTASSMKSAFSTSSVKSAASRVWQRLAGSGGVGDDSKSTASKKTVPSKLVASIKNVFTKKQTDNLDWFDALLVDVKYSTAEDDCNVFNSPNEYLNAAKDLVTQGESLEYLMPYLKCANNMFQDQPTTNPFDRVAAMIVLAGLTNGDNEHALTEDFFKKATALVYQQVKGFRVDFDENGVAIYKDSQIDTLIKASTYATQLKQSLGIFLAHNEVLSVIIGTGFYDYVVADAALAGTTKSSAPVKVIHELKLVATAFGKTFENEKASFEYAQHLMNAAMIDPSKSADYAREAADVLGPLHNRLAAQEGVLASKYWVHVPLYYARALQLSNESTSSPATLLNFNDEYMDKVVLKLYKNWYNNARKIKDEIRLKNNQDLYSTWMAVGRHFGSKRSKTPA